MWGKFLYYILQFQGLIVLTLVSLIVLTLAVLLLMKDFSWNRRRRLMVMTLFFNMPVQYMVYLAANYIQLMFVWSTLLFSVHMELSHLIFLILLGLIQAVSIAQIGEGIRSFIGSVLLYAAFLIVDLLKSYIFDMRFDWRIAFVCCLLSVFLLLYSVYFFINSIRCLAARDEVLTEKAKRLIPHIRHKTPVEESGLVDLDEVELEDVDWTEDAGVMNDDEDKRNTAENS